MTGKRSFFIITLFITLLSGKTEPLNNLQDNKIGEFDNEKVYLNGYYLDELKQPSYISQILTKCLYFEKSSDYTKNKIYGIREGEILSGRQNGYWYTRCIENDKIIREEYFKQGIRDSIYKIYDNDGNVLYSTLFDNGNGIEKDFHKNGALYYEIEIKNSHFTDTLRIYDEQGRIKEKILFNDDYLLVYYQSFNYPE